MSAKKLIKSSEKLSEVIVKGMQEKKASNIVVIDLRKIGNAVADYFILCSGGSDNQVDAIAESIDKEVYENFGENPWHTEGKKSREWLLIDYVDVVAHIFKKSSREYYKLENLWGDAEITYIEEE